MQQKNSSRAFRFSGETLPRTTPVITRATDGFHISIPQHYIPTFPTKGRIYGETSINRALGFKCCIAPPPPPIYVERGHDRWKPSSLASVLVTRWCLVLTLSSGPRLKVWREGLPPFSPRLSTTARTSAGGSVFLTASRSWYIGRRSLRSSTGSTR